MIDYINEHLFLQDGVHKQLVVDYGEGVITNSDLHYENFELEESICKESQLKFGCCNSSILKFRVVNPFDSLKGKNLTVNMVLNHDNDNPFLLGKYKVYSDVPSADRKYRDITAYDKLYEIINTNVSDWYNALFTEEAQEITLKDFRDAFFDHFDVEQEVIELPNDAMSVSKTIEGDEIAGKLVINAICEINGCFGRIGRDGRFQYIHLPKTSPDSALYPSNTLYPDSYVFPIEQGNGGEEGEVALYPSKRYKGSPIYEDYIVREITGIQIRAVEDDIGVSVGLDENKYVVESNFLTYGKSIDELTQIASELYDAIHHVTYRPCFVNAVGNPCVEAGDSVRIQTKTITIDSYVMKRTLKGIQSLNDSFEANGEEYYAREQNTIEGEIRALKGKTNVLERTIDETKSTISDVEKGLQTQIKQNAESITAKVSKGDVSSQLSLETGQITLSGNRVVIDSTNFKVAADGSIEATNATLSGKFISHSSNRTCYINNGQIVLFPEKVIDPSTYEGDDYAVLSYNSLFINGHGYLRSLAVSESIELEYSGCLRREGKSSSWFNGRDNAAFQIVSLDGYSPAISVKTSTASWEAGAYNGYADELVFTSILDSNYNSTMNTISGQVRFTLSGGIITSSGINAGGDIWNNYASGEAHIGFNGGKSMVFLYSKPKSDTGDVVWGMYDNTYKSMMTFRDNGNFYIDKPTFINSRVFIPPEGGAGIRPNGDNAYSSGHSSYRWTTVYAKTSAINTSDRNQKKDFRTFDSNENYEELFLDLKPTVYKFKDGTSNRDHFGFISQDVEESLYKFGFNDKSFGGFCKDVRVDEDEQPVLDEDGNEQYLYSLRYEEFISLNTYMIQKLYKRIEELERKISS